MKRRRRGVHLVPAPDLRFYAALGRFHTVVYRFAHATLRGAPSEHLERLERALLKAAERVSRLERGATRCRRRRDDLGDGDNA